MDGKGRDLDNISIEPFWRFLKYECVYLDAWETGSQVMSDIGHGSNPTTTDALTPPMAVNRPLWSTLTASKPLSRCRQKLKSPGNLYNDRRLSQFFRIVIS